MLFYYSVETSNTIKHVICLRSAEKQMLRFFSNPGCGMFPWGILHLWSRALATQGGTEPTHREDLDPKGIDEGRHDPLPLVSHLGTLTRSPISQGIQDSGDSGAVLSSAPKLCIALGKAGFLSGPEYLHL